MVNSNHEIKEHIMNTYNTYKLVIAEKPSVAKTIARVLGATNYGTGCYTGNGYIVSWCYGHLVELAYPEAYTPQYKRWSLTTLPSCQTRLSSWFLKAVLKNSFQF